MMRKPIDKKAVWSDICCMVEEAVGPMSFQTLVNQCWLDSLEDGKAIVCVENEVLAGIVRRRAGRALEFAFQQYEGKSIQVLILHGRPRIHVLPPKKNTGDDALSRQQEREKNTLEWLHAQYGDIMGIVDNHPTFKRASRVLEKGGWGIFPQLLTNACKEYGVVNVLQGLTFIASRPSVRNPRAMFFTLLKNGQFGHRLAVGARNIGPIPETAQVR